MITKRFGLHFHSEGGALTLPKAAVHDGCEEGGVHSRTHESGWTITGEIHEDYYDVWVNAFQAQHPKFGIIMGDFEIAVFAESEEAFQHFWKHHEPKAWDYKDI